MENYIIAQETNDRVRTTKGINLEAIENQANMIADKCTDLILYPERLRVAWDSGELKMRIGKEQYTFSAHSFSQLCNMVGVPAKFMKKCAEDFPELVLENINKFLRNQTKPMFFRFYGDQIRGILSKKFAAMDTNEVVTSLRKNMDNGYEVKNLLLTPERFHVRLIDPEMLPIDGEDLFAGIQIDNSDVGRSGLYARYTLFKLICTNGLTVDRFGGDLFSQRHIGIDANRFQREFSRNMDKLPEVSKNLKNYIEAARGSEFIVRDFEEALEADPIIQKFKIDTRAGDDHIEKLVNLHKKKYHASEWGLINAITDLAQGFNVDRRQEMEKFASGLLFKKR